MVFSNLTFVCLFLPLALALYHGAPHSVRNLVLVVAIVGTGIALLLHYNLEHSGPLDIRGQPLEQKERQQK